jgi:Tol biopolymer transport system component
VAGAIADGTPVDWAKEVEAMPDPEQREVMRQLEVVAGLASVHRTPDPSTHDHAGESSPEPVRDSWGTLELRRKIGKGSFGTVYLSWDPSLEREVALKILQASDRSEAVIQEGRLLARVRHPNVVTVYGVDQFDGIVGLWMEFVDGLTFKELLQERGVFGPHEAALVGVDLCRAVGAVHKAGLLHRDIKTQNVMREAGGRVVLMDFGAGAVRAGRPHALRRLTGTPMYLAPEVFGGQPASVPSDIYSIGVLLYHLLTNRYPVEGESVGDLEAAHAQQRMTPLSDVRPDLPAGITTVVERALHRDPARRQQSAGEMQQQLLSTIAPQIVHQGVDSGAPAEQRRDRRSLWRAITAAAVLAGATTLGVWYVGGRERPLALGKPRQLTTLPGWESEPKLSPDGAEVAYTSDQSANADIWVLDIANGARRQLTDDPAVDRSPTWVPDGRALMFVSERSGRPAIWKMPRLGGSPVMVIDNAEDPAVSPDGSTIAFARREPGGFVRIGVAPLANTDDARILTKPDNSLTVHRQPAWSPDGRTIVYAAFRDLWQVSATGSESRRLTFADLADRDPAWSPDGAFIYFSSNREGTRAVWRMPSAGGSPVRLTGGQGPEGQPSVATDGARLVYSTYVDRSNIAMRDVLSGDEQRIDNESVEYSPALSVDGRTLVFTSNRWANRIDLWLQPLDAWRPAREPLRLTDHPGSAAHPAFSPDGRWIAYYRVVQGQRDIWVVPSNGGASLQFTNDPAVDIHPDWSPDGTRLAFVSERSGTREIWTQPIGDGRPKGQARQITTGRIRPQAPRWSPDGKMIAFIEDAEVWIVGSDGTAVARKLTTRAGADRVRWDRSSGMLWASGLWDGTVKSLRVLDLRTGQARAPSKPVMLSNDSVAEDFDLSVDGRHVAVARVERRGDLWIYDSSRSAF